MKVVELLFNLNTKHNQHFDHKRYPLEIIVRLMEKKGEKGRRESHRMD